MRIISSHSHKQMIFQPIIKFNLTISSYSFLVSIVTWSSRKARTNILKCAMSVPICYFLTKNLAVGFWKLSQSRYLGDFVDFHFDSLSAKPRISITVFQNFCTYFISPKINKPTYSFILLMSILLTERINWSRQEITLTSFSKK